MDVRDFYRGLFTKEESEDAREGRNAYEYGQVEAQQEHYNSKTGSDVENVDISDLKAKNRRAIKMMVLGNLIKIISKTRMQILSRETAVKIY